MELHMFGRFHLLAGKESVFEEALREVLPLSREEAGCLEIHGFRSIQDGRLFYVHSRRRDEEAFEGHAKMAHTVKFLECVGRLIDHALDVTRAERIG